MWRIDCILYLGEDIKEVEIVDFVFKEIFVKWGEKIFVYEIIDEYLGIILSNGKVFCVGGELIVCYWM